MNAHQHYPTRLEWLQPKAGHGEFHLVAGGTTLGVVHVGQGNNEKLKFAGPPGTWEIRSEGFWSSSYRLRESARQIDIARYTPKWHGAEGVIQFSSGPQFTWKVTGMLTGKYAVRDSSGREIVQVRLGLDRKTRWSDWARTQGTVDVDAGPYDEKIVTGCLVFAWFLVLLNRDYDGSSTAAVTAAMG